MKRTLVPDAREWWQWGSTRVLLILAALLPTWQSLPPEVQDMVPETWRPFLVSGLAVAGVVLRVTQRADA